MINIFPKIKINNLTYIVFLSFLITGYIKNIILIVIIVLVHELGHAFFINLFKYKIEKIEILPFGGFTTSNKPINTKINKDLIIYFGGVLFQIILGLIFNILNKYILQDNTYYLFKTYNKMIILFNLLPIRPLDGGEIMKLLIEKKLSYKKAQNIANIISVILLVIFFILNIKYSLNQYIIFSFLIFKLGELIKKNKYYQNKFLLERHIYNIPYKKIENNKVENINLLKKETFHYFKRNNKYVSEKELLRQKFDINNYF